MAGCRQSRPVPMQRSYTMRKLITLNLSNTIRMNGHTFAEVVIHNAPNTDTYKGMVTLANSVRADKAARETSTGITIDRNNARWTKPERDGLELAVAAGKTVPELARHFNRSQKAISQAIIRFKIRKG